MTELKSKISLEVQTKRPEFEAAFLRNLQGITAKLNDLPSLQEQGFIFTVGFEATPMRGRDEGTNWGTSYYEDWGTFNLRLERGENYVDLATYRAQSSYGAHDLATQMTRNKKGYGEVNFSEPEKFSKFLDQVLGSATVAIAEDFKLGGLGLAEDLEQMKKQLTAEQVQQQAIENAVADLKHAFANLEKALPDMDLKDIITGPLADYAFGPKAPWANLPHRRMVDTMPANVGSCVMCVYLDGPQQEPWVLVGERPDPKNPGQYLYNGSGGGFGNLLFSKEERAQLQTEAFGEQPRDTAVREFSEENRTPENKPIFTLNPEKLRLIDTGEGVDYGAVANGGLPTAYSMHYAFLTDAQKAAAKAHATGMEDDGYRAACAAHTHNETSRMRVMRLAEAAALPTEGFAYPHEAKAFRTMQALHMVGKLVP